MTNKEFKVDFFCVGVAKAGTTTLHELLNLQEKICLPKIKETNHFSFGWKGKPNFTGPLDESSVNAPTVTSFDDYKRQFNYQLGDVVGEVCPSYVLPGTAARIHEHNPNAKIIILLRDPVRRAYSNYQHLVRDGREPLSFEEALAAEEERLGKGWEWFWGLKSNSYYSESVNEYINKFGKDNVKIVYFEEFIKDQQNYLNDILAFLEMESSAAEFVDIKSNQSGMVSEKWRVAHRLLLAEGGLNSLLRKVLPLGLRKRLGKILKGASTVKGSINDETIAILTKEFEADLNQLNDIVGSVTEAWCVQGQRKGDVS